MRKTRAFTLIELLVVVAIIALLVAILLPSLSKAKEMANRSACAANQKAIGSAFGMYRADSGGAYPVMYKGYNYGGQLNQSFVTTDYAPFAEPDPNTTRAYGGPLQQTFWIPIAQNMVSEQVFLCPSTRNVLTDRQQSGVQRYGFASGNNVSYGLHWATPYRLESNGTYTDLRGAAFAGWLSWRMESAAVILADECPSDGTDPRLRNSPNHKEEGQNALFVDGHAEFFNTIRCGWNTNRLYTRDVKPWNGSEAGVVRADGEQGYNTGWTSEPQHWGETIIYHTK